jgi:hypothetical protein
MAKYTVCDICGTRFDWIGVGYLKHKLPNGDEISVTFNVEDCEFISRHGTFIAREADICPKCFAEIVRHNVDSLTA